MKKALFSILLLVAFQSYSQAPDMYTCRGESVFDLTPQTAILLGDLSPGDFTVSYHLSLSDANLGINPILNSTSFVVSAQQTTIFARVQNNNTGEFTTDSFLLIRASVPPAWQYPDVTTCEASYRLMPIPFGSYFTAPGGNPEDRMVGLYVYDSMTIYIYGETENGNCVYETSFHITVDTVPEVPQLSNQSVADFYILPNLAHGNYFTQPNGSGTPLFAGDVITTSQLIYIFAGNENCSRESIFYVEITSPPDPVPNPDIQWQDTFGGNREDVPSRIKTTSDLGYIVVGSTQSNDGDVTGFSGLTDAWILKLDQSGAIQWTRTYGGSNYEYAQDVIQLADGGYAIVGFSNSPDTTLTGYQGLSDAFILRLDSNGNILWEKAFGSVNDDGARGILETATGDLLVVGYTYLDDTDVAGYPDILLFKTNSAGEVLWQKTYGGTSADFGNRIIVSPDGGYLIGAITSSDDGDFTQQFGLRDCALLKLDSEGEIQWTKVFGTVDAVRTLDDISATADGGYIVAGQESTEGGIDQPNGLITKFDSSGSIQWQSNINAVGGNVSVHETVDGSFVALTDTGARGNLNLLHISDTGTNLSENIFEATGFSIDSQLTPDGGLIACGAIYTQQIGTANYLIVKMLPQALESNSSIFNAFTYYPNPVSDVLKISNNDIISSVSVFNMIGQLVYEKDFDLTALEINFEPFSKGIYIIKVKSGATENTFKVIKK